MPRCLSTELGWPHDHCDIGALASTSRQVLSFPRNYCQCALTVVHSQDKARARKGKACSAPLITQSPQLSVERSAILVGHFLVCSFCDTSAPVKLDQECNDRHVDNFGLRSRHFLLPRTQSIARQVINCQVLDTATIRTICTCKFLA